MIKYLGSKRRLVPHLLAAVEALPEVRSVLDLFSGSARVAHACKQRGYRVIANDHMRYAAVLARGLVQADAEILPRVLEILGGLERVEPAAGWFTRTYCEEGRYFRPENGARIEAVREAIANGGHEPELEAVLLTSLMLSADRVDSTTGVQMAFLKHWSPRSGNALRLRVPELLPRAAHGRSEALELDALEAARSVEVDVAYLDPPYNQHKYVGNYHVWETLARWDRPETFGKARKRIDCKTRGSDFNSRLRCKDAFERVVTAVRAKALVVSFSDEGWMSPHEVAAMLAVRAPVFWLACDHPRYVGARIGIHNSRGEKVGTISHLSNKEFLFVATADRGAADRLLSLGYRSAAELLQPA